MRTGLLGKLDAGSCARAVPACSASIAAMKASLVICVWLRSSPSRAIFLLSREAHQRLRVLGRRRLVPEIHGDIAPARASQPAPPPLEIRGRIGLQPQAHVAPWRSLYKRRRCVVLALGQAKRGAGASQRVVDLIREPGFVAELECRPMIRRQELKKGGEPRYVLLQHRRQLEEDGAALFAERRERAIEKG